MKSFVPIVFAFATLLLTGVSHSQPERIDDLELIVFGDHSPPFIRYDENGEAVGEMVDRVRELMDRTSAKYRIQLVPWSRAYHSVFNIKNSLIMNLDRTVEREPEFHWLAPLKQSVYYLHTRNDPAMLELSHEEVVEGGYLALCEMESAACKMLERFGFPADQIIEFTNVASDAGPQMLVQGRADFLISESSLVERGLARSGLMSQMLATTLNEFLVDSYLAIHKSADPEIVQMLRSAIASNP